MSVCNAHMWHPARPPAQYARTHSRTTHTHTHTVPPFLSPSPLHNPNFHALYGEPPVALLKHYTKPPNSKHKPMHKIRLFTLHSTAH